MYIQSLYSEEHNNNLKEESHVFKHSVVLHKYIFDSSQQLMFSGSKDAIYCKILNYGLNTLAFLLCSPINQLQVKSEDSMSSTQWSLCVETKILALKLHPIHLLKYLLPPHRNHSPPH